MTACPEVPKRAECGRSTDWLGDVATFSLTRHSLVGNPYWIRWYWERSFKKCQDTNETTLTRTSCILQKPVKTTRLLSVILRTPSRQKKKNHSYCRVTRRAVAAAGVGYSWTQQLFCSVFFFLLQTSATTTPDAPASRQLNAVKQLSLLVARFHFVVEIFKYETHLKPSCSYRGSIPTLEWSHY